MIKSIASSVFLIALSIFGYAQTCSTQGNVMIFSNYDGGILTINVDVNIPNLKIGICTYEPVQIVLTGPFVGNVTAVVYAGFNSNQNNNNCNQGNFPTSISGVPAGITQIITAPAVTLDDPNGYPLLIGAVGNCTENTSTGGVNTTIQIVDYFLNFFGGSLYAHHSQYGCWLNQTLSISAGGTCCIQPEVDPICCTGDFNCDGIYNTTDISIFLSQFGCSGCEADFDLNGTVGVSDLAVMTGLFGSICP